jgi:hypothetical protein
MNLEDNGEDGRLFRSDDGAATWRRVGKAPEGGGPWSLIVDPRSPDRVRGRAVRGSFRVRRF